MITLLRRIRRSLIDSGSKKPASPARPNGLLSGPAGRYLLYAIGEIALVVIGILIALQINNWNENRKSEDKTRSILMEIQDNLLDDIEQAKRVVDIYLTYDSLEAKVFDFENPYTYEDIQEGRVSNFIIRYFDFVINRVGYENLTLRMDELPKEFKPLLIDLKTLYVELYEDIQGSNSSLINTVQENSDFLYSNNWRIHRLRYNEPTQEEMDYYLYSDDYKNRVLKCMDDRRTLLRMSQMYRTKAVETYQKINTLLGIKDDELPPQEYGKITSETKYLLGDYIMQDSSTESSISLFVVNNQLISRNNDSGDSTQHLLLNDRFGMYIQPGVRSLALFWKANRYGDGKIEIESITNSFSTLIKKD